MTEDERYILLDGLDALSRHYEDQFDELAKIGALMDKIDPWYDDNEDDDEAR